MGRTEAPHAGSSASDKWWIPVFLLAVELPATLAPYAFSRAFVTPMPLASSFGWLFFDLTRLGILLSVVSGVAVYFDRRYVASASDWHPSEAYYLVAIPTLVNVVATVYLYNRHRRVGTP